MFVGHLAAVRQGPRNDEPYILPIPSGVTNPSPVTTTRRIAFRRSLIRCDECPAPCGEGSSKLGPVCSR
jgi:hypothetical protein